jgi:hypothetical protein
MSEGTEAPLITGQGPSPSLRLLAAERLSQIEGDRPAEPAIDLRAAAASGSEPDAVARQLAAVAGAVAELAQTTRGFQELLTGRHLDYSEQVQRLVATSEQALADHRAASEALADEVRGAVSMRDTEIDRMGAAVGHISRDLAGIIEQVMAAVRHGREVSDQNDELSRQFLTNFQLATRHLAEQGQVLRGEIDRLLEAHAGTTAPTVDVRAEVDAAISELRDELREDLGALRKLLSRPGDTSAADWREALAAVRIDVISEMEAWVRDLHENQAQMMRAVVAGHEEMEELRREVARIAERASEPDPAPAPALGNLETEIGRLLIELRALRRRPLTERSEQAQRVERAAVPPKTDRPERIPLAQRAKLQPARRPVTPPRAPLRARRVKRA